MDTIKQVLRNRVSRRKFMAGIGAGVGATAAVAMAAGCDDSSSKTTTPTNPTPPALTDLDILNFALSLEYLGAEYYLRALTGSGVPDSAAGSSAGSVTGGTVVPGLAGTLVGNIAADLAQDELGHIVALRAAITGAGGTPVSRPQIDFTGGFTKLAAAAGINNGSFNPFVANGAISAIDSFLLGAFVFEDVDVTAYTGAAPLISSATVLNAAAGIQGVEAYHAGIIRTLIVSEDALASSSTLTTTANQIQTVRSTLGGGNETTLSSTAIVSANSSNAVGFARTPDQVLHIVYATGGGAGASKGGFFPAGITGTITTTAS